MIGRASAFLHVIKTAAPQMVRALGADSRQAEAEFAMTGADQAYSALIPGDFSQQVLSVSTRQLAVLRLGDVGWSDPGTPERVRFAMARYGLRSHRQKFADNENVEYFAKTSIS